MPASSKSETVSLSRMEDALEVFRAVDPEMSAHTIVTFLEIALHDPEPYPLRDLADRLGMSTSAASRNATVFLKNTWKGKKGAAWVTVAIAEDDRRLRNYSLTQKGKIAKTKVLKALGVSA